MLGATRHGVKVEPVVEPCPWLRRERLLLEREPHDLTAGTQPLVLLGFTAGATHKVAVGATALKYLAALECTFKGNLRSIVELHKQIEGAEHSSRLQLRLGGDFEQGTESTQRRGCMERPHALYLLRARESRAPLKLHAHLAHKPRLIVEDRHKDGAL